MAAGKKTGGRKAGTPNKATRGFLEAQAELQKRFDAELNKKGKGKKKSRLDDLIESLVTRAIAGDSEAQRIVMDRWAGRPKQHIEATGPNGGKMEMVVTLVGERAKPTD